MDKLTKMMKGRLRVAAVMMVCVLAIVALPTFAYAATAWTSSFPASGAVSWGQPQVVSVDLFGAAAAINPTTASITINGTPFRTFTQAGAASGHWAATQALNANNVWQITWTWTADTLGATKTTLFCYPSGIATGTAAVVAAATDIAGTVITPAAWSFTLNTAPTPIDPVVPSDAVQTCRSSNCHGTGYDADNAMGPICSDCHTQDFAPHGFVYGASGHSTTLLGARGPYTKFDGSGSNPTLTWTAKQSFTVSSLKNGSGALASPFTQGSTFTTGQAGTVSTTWDFPTLSVFWPSGDTTTNATIAQAPPTGAMKGLTKDSIITCEDCHTSLAAAGPKGAAAANYGLDSNFQGDYAYAGLTKQVTAAKSLAGATTTFNGYSTSGIMSLPTTSTTPVQLKAAWSDKANWLGDTSTTTAVICAKCHRLETAFRGFVAANGETSRTIGTSGVLGVTIEGANTAHDSHHQDATDGSNQCVSCHVALPHGWQSPRLLIDIEGGEFVGTRYESTMAIEAMGPLAALNNHPAIADTGFLPYATGNGVANVVGAGASYNIAHVGQVLWDESQCTACGDHYGDNAFESNASGGALPPGQIGTVYGNGQSVPVTIDQTPVGE